MKNLSIRLLLPLILACLVAPLRADINLQFQDSTDALNAQLSEYLNDSGVIGDFLQVVDENFRFEQSLDIVIGAENGPFYDKTSRTLNMPYAWFADAVRAQAELVEEGEESLAVERAVDMYEYVLYHLLAHALIDDGDEAEDATVEAVSSWIMIRGWPNGGEQWIADVRAFADASQKLDGPLSDYWHAHGLYKIRRETIECWILGSDPQRHEKLLPAVVDPSERIARCRESWNKLESSVAGLLVFYLKDTAPLRAFIEPQSEDAIGDEVDALSESDPESEPESEDSEESDESDGQSTPESESPRE